MIFYFYFIINYEWLNKNFLKLDYSEKKLEYIRNDNISMNEYAYIYKFIVLGHYTLPFKNILTLFSFLIKNKNEISKLDKKYNYDFKYLKQITEYIYLTNTNNIYINDTKGLDLFELIIQYELPILGIKLIKMYYLDEIIELNNYMILKNIKEKNYQDKNNKNLFQNFIENS